MWDGNLFGQSSSIVNVYYTVDGKNPALPGMYKTLQILTNIGRSHLPTGARKGFLNHQQYQPVPTWKVFWERQIYHTWILWVCLTHNSCQIPLPSSVQNPGCLGYIGDEILPFLNGDYFISQYKDPYKPISIMECHMGVFHTARNVFLEPHFLQRFSNARWRTKALEKKVSWRWKRGVVGWRKKWWVPGRTKGTEKGPGKLKGFCRLFFFFSYMVVVS